MENVLLAKINFDNEEKSKSGIYTIKFFEAFEKPKGLSSHLIEIKPEIEFFAESNNDDEDIIDEIEIIPETSSDTEILAIYEMMKSDYEKYKWEMESFDDFKRLHKFITYDFGDEKIVYSIPPTKRILQKNGKVYSYNHLCRYYVNNKIVKELDREDEIDFLGGLVE